ncbi:pseudoazurin [Swingsia samuiensis]|uniref:Pseudoazurin n=1 Tax=Swingsia samuiensis TaxID=1293412 RepID=A0A4Y6UGB6_9PROT|nr:pseudoazurin [Swingsia samuiensis]QDH16599.1 pseudoazurin [Swingsia samuiensis]
MKKSSLLNALIIVLCLPFIAHAKTVDVKMISNGPNGERGFVPAVVYLHSGDSVHFIAQDFGHNAVSIPGMLPEGAKPFAGQMSQDLTVRFSKAGIYGYKCLPHYFMGMVGLVVVDNKNNEQAVKNIEQPGAAKEAFDKLFSQVDQKKF